MKKIISCLVLLLPVTGWAQQVWDGDTSTTFSNGANWVGGVAPSFGNANIFFPSSLTNFEPDMTGVFQAGVQNLEFDGAGWTVSDSVGGGGFRLDVTGTSAPGATIPGGGLYSSGAGVNTINARVEWASNVVAPKVRIEAGNTLHIAGNYSQSKSTEYSGAGTLVLSGPDKTTAGFNSAYNIADGGFTILFNSIQDVSQTTFAQGRVGGTGGLIAQDYQTTTFAGATLAPGGNGTFGDEISSFQFLGESALRTELTLSSGTIVEMQLGSGGLGDNDQILLDLNVDGTFTIGSGVTLSLLGGVIQDGTYTLISDIGDTDPFVGTFGTVLFNGAAIDPANFTVNYGTDSITLTVTGVPEPGVAMLIYVGCSVLFLAGRRKGRAM